MSRITNSSPYIIEKKDGNERAYDLSSRLLMDRIIMLSGPIEAGCSIPIISQLLLLEADDSKKDIYMYINSPGGHITEMFAIFDTMQYIKPDINTIAVGEAYSAASFLLAAGAKGKRFSLPNSSIMIHQPLGGASGQVSEIEIITGELVKLKNKLIDYYASFTGKSKAVLKRDLDRDFYLDPKQAIDYGLIDHVQVKRA